MSIIPAVEAEVIEKLGMRLEGTELATSDAIPADPTAGLRFLPPSSMVPHRRYPIDAGEPLRHWGPARSYDHRGLAQYAQIMHMDMHDDDTYQ
ncbi:MAG: hypothetical protein KatS3mg081_0836 [Gemmatimonadales bacterium]|nr:MAG: hypothetical protein KatS3mg081_0836 [Gemmatimonadales bacterium]